MSNLAFRFDFLMNYLNSSTLRFLESSIFGFHFIQFFVFFIKSIWVFPEKIFWVERSPLKNKEDFTKTVYLYIHKYDFNVE